MNTSDLEKYHMWVLLLKLTSWFIKILSHTYILNPPAPTIQAKLKCYMVAFDNNYVQCCANSLIFYQTWTVHCFLIASTWDTSRICWGHARRVEMMSSHYQIYFSGGEFVSLHGYNWCWDRGGSCLFTFHMI